VPGTHDYTTATHGKKGGFTTSTPLPPWGCATAPPLPAARRARSPVRGDCLLFASWGGHEAKEADTGWRVGRRAS